MSVSRLDDWRLRRDELAATEAQARYSTTGGGGPTSGDMEARVKALEDKFDKIDGKLDGLVKDVSYLKGKVDNMPTSLQLLGFALAVFIAAGLMKYLAP